ncbi:unnamed protein product [Rotaria sp. Silwood1]|nr:unnamed protein product [Rotaria sp. Silwood1]CAF3446518.1 unnamed protein product [Rotaria sp. Silwood1]
MFNINTSLNRCVKIWNILLDQFQLLETMTPIEFLEFRDYIIPASGFQSLQFRLIEFKLGLNDKLRHHYHENYFTHVMFKNQQAEELKNAASEQSLLALLERWLEQVYDSTSFDFLENGISFDSVNIEAENLRRQFSNMLNQTQYAQLKLMNERRMSHKAMLAALMISVYHQQPCFQQAYQMLYLLMDIDALIANWRQKHIQLVQRHIGRKPGTGVGPESSTAIPFGKRVKAMWNGVIIADSDKAIKFDNNIYFPPDSINRQYVEDSSTHTTCPWKGVASYMTIVVGDEEFVDAMWYYPMPKEAAIDIKGYFAFLPDVQIVED